MRGKIFVEGGGMLDGVTVGEVIMFPMKLIEVKMRNGVPKYTLEPSEEHIGYDGEDIRGSIERVSDAVSKKKRHQWNDSMLAP